MPANDNAVVGDKIALEPENNPHKLIGAGNLPAFLFTAAKLDTGISKTASKATVFANARSIQTHGDVRKYLEIVATKLATIHPPKM
jgi:hypothetical protein